MQDGKHIDAYRLEVQLPQTKALLQVDTAASGVFISRAMADANGLKPGEGATPGTVHADRIQIGPLEVRNCIVGVSDTAFGGKTDGFIGTDIFAAYLITLDYAQARLMLAPLPPVKGSVPGDRPLAAELEGFVPVYHKQQYPLVPTLLNNKERRLFVLDTGMRYSTMTSEVAHQVSTTKVNFTNSAQTASGGKLEIYRDSFDFQFGDLELLHRAHIIEFDTSTIEQSAGLQVGGMLGFDLLHSMTMQLDYRDGLVRFNSIDPTVAAVNAGPPTAASMAASAAAAKAACPRMEQAEYQTASTIEAVTTDFWDSAHVRAGETFTVQVAHEWISQECRLLPGARLYGHVMAAAASKNSGMAQLAIVFDHGDCYGKGKKELPLKVVGVVGLADDGPNSLHSAMPTQMSGGGKQISDAAAALGDAVDQNLNPGGAPRTIKPGIVLNMPAMKLDPQGGPACSSLLTSSNRSVKLQKGTDFLVMMVDSLQVRA